MCLGLVWAVCVLKVCFWAWLGLVLASCLFLGLFVDLSLVCIVFERTVKVFCVSSVFLSSSSVC